MPATLATSPAYRKACARHTAAVAIYEAVRLAWLADHATEDEFGVAWRRLDTETKAFDVAFNAERDATR